MVKRQVKVIRISPPQKEFVESTAQITGFTGGRGAGKTVAGSINILWNAVDGENIMAVSPTYPIAKETTFKYSTLIFGIQALDNFIGAL